MKQMKIALMALMAIFVGSTFTSCLDSDDSNSWDFADTVTLQSTYGSNTYKCDNYPYTITLTNGSQVFGENYPERAYLYFKLAEGEVITEGKTTYSAAIVEGFSIFVKDFCFRTDTLNIDNENTEAGKGSPVFYSIEKPTTSGNYLNVSFSPAVSDKTKMDYFNMYLDKADGNTLYVTLHQDEVTEAEAYSQMSNGGVFMNFRLPDAFSIENALGAEEYAKLEFFGANNDSINLIINAKGSNKNTVSSQAAKVRIRNY